MNRAAFSLIELVISIALGVVVLAVGFSAIRVAATTISVGNRLITENALLRQTLLTGLDHLDFGAPGEFNVPDLATDSAVSYWKTSKPVRSILAPGDAVEAAYQHLSRTALANRPCEDWWNWRANLDGNGWSYAVDPATAATVFEFQPAAILPLGNPIRPSYQRDLENDGDHLAMNGITDDAYQAMVNWGKSAQIDFYTLLGFQAMLEYMPPNAVFYCGPTTKGLILSGKPPGVAEFGNSHGINPKWTGASKTWMSSGSPFDLATRLQRRNTTGNDIADGGVAGVLFDTSDRPWGDLMNIDGGGRAGWDGNWIAVGQQPNDWPRCGVIIQRAWTDTLRLNRVEVKMRSPVTGQDLSISFNCVGPDLPGMRKSHGLHD